MLGETQGTSAGGASETGKFLRIPGTNPFFAYRNDWQGNRFYELLQQVPIRVYLINTGRVGGPEGDERSKDVNPEHTAGGGAGGSPRRRSSWDNDPTWAPWSQHMSPGSTTSSCSSPAGSMSARAGATEYQTFLDRLREDRRAHLDGYDQLHPSICDAV